MTPADETLAELRQLAAVFCEKVANLGTPPEIGFAIAVFVVKDDGQIISTCGGNAPKEVVAAVFAVQSASLSRAETQDITKTN
jgi:hypothetical protein